MMESGRIEGHRCKTPTERREERAQRERAGGGLGRSQMFVSFYSMDWMDGERRDGGSRGKV